MLDYIFTLDTTLILGVGNLQKDWLTPIMTWFTTMGDTGMIWIIFTACLLLLSSFRFSGITLTIGLFINLVLGEWILKHLFDRARPFEDLPTILLYISPPITSSFPSGHSSASICFACIFTYFFWKKSKYNVLLIWLLALGITFSRFYLQVHYPSDILWWIFVWILSARIAVLISKYYKQKLIRL